MGRRHAPFFRVSVMESRCPRDGKVIEEVGYYNPIEKDESKQIVLKADRILHWLGQGAVATETVANMLKKAGIVAGK
ncbi:MAG: 30S ribosomal protein S16 [Sedimentisphaerales bacterium]|nr:30S ribosomal protein S16 [Sedimentisphaerales bacterium]MBN2842988.1 30S ribosomal protein S16 [Sedimentisphaerales bacterium]